MTETPTAPIRIHRFPLSGHSHRVELFCALNGIALEKIEVDLIQKAQKDPAFLALNPLGLIPVIEDGTTILSDSNAILVYLARRYAPDWLPADPAEEARVHQFLALAAGDIYNGPGAARRSKVFGSKADPAIVAAATARALGFLEAHLGDRNWVVVDRPTIADISLYTYIAHAPEGDVSLEPYPEIRAWLARIEALPGFIAMPASDGPIMLYK
ncbi:MAG: glutathione S-transferase family protein [Rhodospirillaceae bacterium]